MPVLIYYDRKNHYQERPFADNLRIGSDEANDLVLPSELAVAPHHAVIMRSVVGRLPIIVNLAGQQTRVNGRPVVSLQVLHQRDEIQLGNLSLKMWELRITVLQAGDPVIKQLCLICRRKFLAGDDVFFCPRCATPCHRDCWFATRNCPSYTCEYPVQSRIVDALSPWVTFEDYKASESDVIEVRGDQTIILRRAGISCHANTRRDLVPFQPGERIAYCPSASCRAPFHLQCWLALKACPDCQYDVQQLLSQVFFPSERAPIPPLAGGSDADR